MGLQRVGHWSEWTWTQHKALLPVPFLCSSLTPSWVFSPLLQPHATTLYLSFRNGQFWLPRLTTQSAGVLLLVHRTSPKPGLSKPLTVGSCTNLHDTSLWQWEGSSPNYHLPWQKFFNCLKTPRECFDECDQGVLQQSNQYSINPATCHDADDRTAEAENEVRSRGVGSRMN